MKRTACVLLALTAAIGLFTAAPASAEVKASKEMLHGAWTGKVSIDEVALKADEKFKEIPAEQADLVLGLLKEQFAKMSMSMTFNADGTASAEIEGPGIPAKDRKKEGTWEVVKTDGDSITVKITSKDEADKEGPKDMVFKCLDEKTMTMGLPGKAGAEMPKGIEFKFTKK
jgi:hypothetical protein